MASSAAAASRPLVATSMWLPCSAASIITPMMLRPFTTWPSFATVTSASKRLAVWTSIAAARAWSPSRLRICKLARCSSVVPAPIAVFGMPGRDGARRGRPEDVLLPVALDEPRERRRVHLATRGGELDEDGHVDARHDLRAGLARDGEALVRGRVAEHVGHDDDALSAIDLAHGAGDAGADRLGAVAVRGGHAHDALERPEDPFERLHHLLRQPPVPHDDDTHHTEILTPGPACEQANVSALCCRAQFFGALLPLGIPVTDENAVAALQ